MLTRVVDENSHQIDEDGKLGELCVKGPCLMLGYLGNPADTAAAFDKEGWIHTGDIGYQNEGKLYCVDRRKVRLFSLYHPKPRIFFKKHLSR